MSDPSAAAISALSEAIRDLTVALAPASADLETASQGEWELWVRRWKIIRSGKTLIVFL